MSSSFNPPQSAQNQTAPAPQAELQRMPIPGDKIGPNHILQVIGEGGSASVYRVWHEGLEVVRAVKVLKPDNGKNSRDRFLTEAKILADIHHPNIIEIHHVGYLQQQIPFLELEYIDGMSVKGLIKRFGNLPLPVALSITYFVCQALEYAHTKDYTLYGKIYKGLIHRDVKPENIIISKRGIVKLMDFGIARPSEIGLKNTETKVMGTLVYLSPEQLNSHPLDQRSDIFSLGTVLYEMICGKRAFPQKTITELIHKKTEGQYRPISMYKQPLPQGLEKIIDKCLALYPEDRFEDAAQLGDYVYKILRLISDKAPQDILTIYMKDPPSIPYEWDLLERKNEESADKESKKRKWWKRKAG
ncbi:Serine/threonine protein kinase PrkC, regulator of stationary phase [Chitinispirillum alkaliphilum]|nr:Serine/threonine protein kinase PrkC, regulator of stationary phase [Chitinispirillum alkaliphilum]